jgi:hypothetical protein
MADFIQGMLAGQQYQLNNFLIQEAPVKLEKEKLALGVAKLDFQRREQMAELLSKNESRIPPGQNPLTSASNTLVEMGSAAAKVGLIDEATQDFSKASTIMAQQEDVAYKQWQQTLQQTKYADQLLSTVHNQAEFDQMNAHIEMTTGQPSHLKGQQYSPELVESLRKAAASKRTEAQEALTRAQSRKSEVDQRLDEERIRALKVQEKLNETRINNANKVGSGGLVAKPATITAVANQLVSDSNDQLSMTDARALADDLSLGVERRMTEDRLTRPQAIQAELQDARRAGRLPSESVHRVGPGTSPKKPLPLPKEVSGFKEGQWYETNDGPRWYDNETKSLYKAGEGPGDEEEEEEP